MENKDRPYQSKEVVEQDIIQHNDTVDEIDFSEIIANLWRNRKFIGIVTGIFLCIGIFIAFASPTRYTAECVIFPQSSKQGAGGALGGVASIMGINLGAAGLEAGGLPPSVYPQILSSWPFIRDVMNMPVRVENSRGKTISLYEYYTDEKYKEKNFLTSIAKYTIGLPGVLLSTFHSSQNDTTLYKNQETDTSNSIRITQEEQNVYNIISNSIKFSYDKKEGTIILAYTFPEAQVAAQITNHLHETLERYVINYKIQKAKENLDFVEKSYAEARKDFLQKQANLAFYQDANRGLITATGRSIENRLRSEYDIAFTVYSELAKQREQASFTLKEEKPILTIIKPVVVPLEKSEPRRGLILISSLILGLLSSMAWLFLKSYILNLKKLL